MTQFIKIESAFLMYFLGRKYGNNVDRCLKSFQDGYLLVFLICVFSYVTKTGFKEWGTHLTFTSYYYFKTDLAAAMFQYSVLCFFSFNNLSKKINIVIGVICLFFIVISNARMYYFLALFVVVFVVMYKLELKHDSFLLKINGMSVFLFFFAIVLILVLLNKINSMLGDGYLLFSFSSADDLYSGGNMQGRNEVWKDIYEDFSQSDFFYRLTGIDLCSDVSDLGHNSHSAYLKVLWSTGYLGIVLYLVFLIQVLKNIGAVCNRKLFYLILLYYIGFILSGISYISIESTQVSWIPMFLFGYVVKNRNNINS